MENAPLIGLSRQIALQRQLEVVSNNLANINTAGFKGERILFEEFIMPTAEDLSLPAGDQSVSFTQDWATMHDLSEGAFKQTGNDLDIALDGHGFLAVDAPEGIRFTRDGQLKINESGILVSSEGFPVRATGGQISFQPSETNIRIDENGSVLSSAGNKGRLQVSEFENPQLLKHAGNNLFLAPEGVAEIAAANTKVRQGMIEGSNISGVREISDMIRVNRSYQMVSQFIQRQDDLRRAAIQKLADVTA